MILGRDIFFATMCFPRILARLLCNKKYRFNAHENGDFSFFFFPAPKYRKYARIKNQGAP